MTMVDIDRTTVKRWQLGDVLVAVNNNLLIVVMLQGPSDDLVATTSCSLMTLVRQQQLNGNYVVVVGSDLLTMLGRLSNDSGQRLYDDDDRQWSIDGGWVVEAKRQNGGRWWQFVDSGWAVVAYWQLLGSDIRSTMIRCQNPNHSIERLKMILLIMRYF